MKKELFTSILAAVLSGGLIQPTAAQTRLVVQLNIDQLRTDYMEEFAPLFGTQGFARLLKEGRVYDQVSFPFAAADRTAAIAAINTGTTPSMNGIVGADWLDAETLQTVNAIDDKDYMGNNTHENSSAQQLLTSTLSDELKIATRGQSLTYSIAPFRDAAILSAGHNANCALWLNEQTGKWCSTTYYKDFPWWLNNYNNTDAPDIHAKNAEWTPLLPTNRYTLIPDGRKDSFKHSLDNGAPYRYTTLASSPFINNEVNRLADNLLQKADIGKDDIPDYLSLTYYGGNFEHKSLQEYSLELQDAYVRMDRSIADLLQILEQRVGLQHVLFFLTSTGGTDPDTFLPAQYNIPSGDFHLNRCATLLNMYLMAIYGNGEYVQGYYKQQIHLNHKLIEDKQLKLSDILDTASEFLVQFSGVNEVYSSKRLLLGTHSEQSERIRQGYHRKRSGDLVVEILPGWNIVDERTGAKRPVNYAQPAAPFIILGNGFKAEKISTPISSNRIAPTICNALHIRAPNACTEQPLERE